MLVINKSNDRVEFEFLVDEIGTIHQAFNEVINGFRVDNFDQTIGLSKDLAKSEMNTLRDYYQNAKNENLSKIRREINLELIHIYINVLKEVFKEIEEWEFHTRMGAQKKEAQKLLDSLQNAVAL